MRAGRLNRWIDVERLGPMDIDDMGVPMDTWATVARLPAEFVPVSVDEAVAGGGIALANVVRFRVRFNETIQETDRVRFGARVFGILGLTEIGHREGLEILCSTKTADAFG